MQARFAPPLLDNFIVFIAALIIAATAGAQSDKKGGYPPTLSGGAPCGSCDAPERLSWKTVIPPEKEPGEPLVITGKVFQPDGKTPAEGMVFWVYHTDRTGYYNAKDDASHPRLKGWMKIGADGRYEFRTIRPGAYPRRTTPAHIHAHVYGPGYSERPIDDYWFKDDPRINAKELKNAADNGGHPRDRRSQARQRWSLARRPRYQTAERSVSRRESGAFDEQPATVAKVGSD